MADCFSLPNAAELVEMLRVEAEAVQAIEWEIPICTSKHLAQAADAIEQLMQENAKLKGEREAAVRDLSLIVHDMDNTCICDYCIGCEKDGRYAPCNTDNGDRWEWRGAQDD